MEDAILILAAFTFALEFAFVRELDFRLLVLLLCRFPGRSPFPPPKTDIPVLDGDEARPPLAGSSAPAVESIGGDTVSFSAVAAGVPEEAARALALARLSFLLRRFGIVEIRFVAIFGWIASDE
jgi:hypothetical protein